MKFSLTFRSEILLSTTTLIPTAFRLGTARSACLQKFKLVIILINGRSICYKKVLISIANQPLENFRNHRATSQKSLQSHAFMTWKLPKICWIQAFYLRRASRCSISCRSTRMCASRAESTRRFWALKDLFFILRVKI